MTPDQERQSATWMRLAQAGDQDAYASLLVMLTAVTRQFAASRVGRVPWIDDVVQETLITIHSARRTYDSTRPFAPWFYAILSSRMIDVLRKERRVGAREVGADVLPEWTAQGGSPVDGADGVDFDRVQAALETLSDRQREVVRALKLRDESVKEVSERLGMSQSAVKVTAHRGYRALRRLLGSRES